MIYSRIVGTGSYLPPRVMTNHDFAARLETSDAWIRERTGIVERHIADKSQASSDLALEASRQALRAADVKAETIDLVVVATSTPDYVFPSTACLLQAKLGVKGSTAFDVQAVCSGFVYGLATADAFIKSGTHKRALVVGTEVFSRILDWNEAFGLVFDRTMDGRTGQSVLEWTYFLDNYKDVVDHASHFTDPANLPDVDDEPIAFTGARYGPGLARCAVWDPAGRAGFQNRQPSPDRLHATC